MVEECKDDDKCGRDRCPGEDTNLTPEGPNISPILGLGVARYESILLFFVTVIGFWGGWAIVCEERLLIFCHGGKARNGLGTDSGKNWREVAFLEMYGSYQSCGECQMMFHNGHPERTELSYSKDMGRNEQGPRVGDRNRCTHQYV